MLAHSTKTKLVESKNFLLDVLHFDPKHRTFNFVSIVCIALTFLLYRSFGSRQLSFERLEKKKGLKRFKGFEGLKFVLCVRELVTY